MSDTHGYESSLTEGSDEEGSNEEGSGEEGSGEALPTGDVLIHGGDFMIDAPDGLRREAVAKFDEWMASQPQTERIVVRGNHDAYEVCHTTRTFTRRI